MSKNIFRGSKLTSIFLLATLIFSGLSPVALFTNSASAASATVVVDPATYSGSGTTITDTVSSINGTMSNVTYEASTNCGVFTYNGSNSAIQFPQKNFGSAFSISTWIMASEGSTSGQTQFNIQTLMSNVGANVAPSGFKVFINNWNSNDGKLIHQAGNNSAGTDVYTNSSNLVSINQWHHIVFTFNQSSPAVAIYKDGTKLDTTGTPVSNIGMNNSNWWLGSMGGNSYWYKGKMGVTKIYPTVLNQTEVTEDYNSSAARYSSTPNCGVTAPTNVAVATGSTTGTLDVSWGAPAELNGKSVTNYQVEYSTSGTGSWNTASSSIASNSTSYTITGLSNATSYYVRVAAKYSGGVGAYGYPWTEIHSVNNSVRSNDLIQYDSGFGIGVGTRQATYASSSFTRVRYRMATTYDSNNYYVDANFNRELGTKSSYSETFDSIEKLQVPSIAGTNAQFEIQANVSDLNVQSNNPNVVDGQGLDGRLEIWPWNYDVAAPSGFTDRQSTTSYGDADTPSQTSPDSTRGNYGSFQLHTLSGNNATLFAWNRHLGDSQGAEVGFGSYSGVHSDWTFCSNVGASPGCGSRSGTFSLKIFINIPTSTLTLSAPTVSSVSITGTANIGQTLTASLSLGGGTPSSTTYQWKVSDSSSGTYSDISGATSSTYVVPTSQVGRFIKLSVSVSNTSGSASGTSSATARVNDGLFLRYDAGNSSSYSGSDTTVNDISGTGISGTLTGDSLTYPGFVSSYGKSFSFDSAKSQYIDIADIPAISFANGFSATAWVNFGTSSNFERIIDLGNGQANSNIIFGRHGTDNELFVDVWDGATQLGYCRAANSIQTGWAHYAVTILGNTCTFYVNGVSVAGTSHMSIDNPPTIARNANFIGKSNWSADNFFESGIARVSLWNRELSSSEIAARATAETPAAEVVLSTSSISVVRGSAITNLTATTYGGTATSFSISPTLPSGLSLNASTGTVSGTPSVGLSSTTFTITANGITGNPTATFTLAISASALNGASAPTVSATSGSSTSISVSFTSVANATSHTVRVYQSDGTTLVSTSTSFSSGSTVTGLAANTAYKVSLQAIGDGTSYSTSAESSKSDVTTNQVVSSYSITYQLDGGSGTAPTQANVNQGSTFLVANSTGLSKNNYLFTGWSDGANVYQSGDTYTVGAGNVTFTAQWGPTDPVTQVFSHTGSAQTWTVPSGVTSITFSLTGGSGGDTHGGKGATVTGTLSVTPGSILQINVGSRGATYTGGSTSNYTSAAFGGGGRGNYYGSGGGGASDIRVGSYALADRVVVAGGGGGGAQMGGYYGGAGGTTTGANGNPTTVSSYFGVGGLGATQLAGGAGGAGASQCGNRAGSNGTLGIGGDGANASAGAAGGGGGYYGGGGGGSGCNPISGGGGSSWVSSSLVSSPSYSVATSLGNGTISITYAGLLVLPTIGSATVSGTLVSTNVLTATAGSLGGGTIASTTYQWMSSDSSNGSYTNISGATNSTFTLTSNEVDKYVKVVVTVTNAVGSASATSTATSQITAPLTAPTLTGASISGTTTQGQTLTASVQGAGGGAATTTTYQWKRADSSSGSYSNISGATSSTYTLSSADVTKYIKVTISVSNSAGGPNSATSSASNAIAIIAPTIGSATFSGTTSTGQTLTATAGSLGGGAVASTTYQWKSSTTSGGVYSDISGATSNTYVLTANEAGRYIKVTITVTNSGGSASATSSASSAAVVSVSPTPTITGISPNAGSTDGGTSVTISGTNLSTVTAVTFDGTAATISTKTSTQLVVSTPAHAAGAVNVVVTNTAGSVTSTNGFTYATTPTTRSWTGTPTITSGANGDPFSVTYQAVCTTPQRYGPSMYDLIYVTPGVWKYNSYMGSGTSSDGGYTWTITKNYTINSNGIWKVDAYMRGACWDSYNFTYSTRQFINVGVSGPTITSLSVTSGPTAGGTATVVTGTNLTGVTGITVGGTAATSIRSNTSTSVTFNTPAGTAGAKNVVITTSAGSVTSTNGFNYVAAITVTYDVNGGTGSPSRTTDSYTPNSGGYSVPVIGTMAKAGYTFGGWATSDTSTTAITSPYNPTSTLTVYAIWTAKNYTTSYIANGADSGTAPSNASNAFGSTVTVAGNSGTLARAGYTLAGWNTAADGSGTSYILGSGTFTQTASNLILYAEWVPDTYTVSYDVNGSSDSVPASHTGQLGNSTVTLRAGVTKANFAFVGWESGGITYKSGASFTLGTSDATMVAKWIAVYKLSYNLNGTGATGSVPADFQYASGDSVTVTNVVPTRAGYTFGGWIDQSGGAHATSSTYTISGTNYLLYAVWNPIEYTVTYALNGGQGTAPTESSKNVNQSFTIATAATKTGSTFAGWSDGTTVYGAGSSYLVATDNITLTAQWTANSYAITYDLAQGTSSVPSALSKAYQASWTLPDAPTRIGYNFSDWYDGTNGYAAGASYNLGTASDLIITARWTVIVYYSVTYDLDGGLGTAPTQDPLQNGQSFTLPSDPSKTGNSFTGWSYAGTTYSSGQTITMPAANVTVTALWTATSAGTYAVTYISNGAQNSAPTTPPLAQNATFTVDDGSGLLKNGYIFAGWTYSGTTYTGGETITMPAASVTLSAVWVPAVRATAVTHSVDATSITRGRSITVTYNVGCYAYSATIPTIVENVSTSGESFINDITSALTVIDAGYNWTVTRVYTLSNIGTYNVFATVSGGCFSTPTESTSSTVTVAEAPSSGGASSGSNNSNNAPAGAATVASARTGSIAPVTVVGAKIALVANKNYTLPKLNTTTTLSVEAKAGSSTTSTSTTTSQSTGITSTTTTMLSVNSASKGLSEVKIVENQIAVVPTVGFSGKTEVSITVTDGSTTTTVTVPVTVLPEPVKDPILTPVAAKQTTVSWEPSPNADSYQVIVDGKTACKAATDTCEVKKILGPNADVQVIANGGDATKSDAVDADYEATKTVVVTKLVGTTRGGKLTQNDINMLNKVVTTVKSQGFETVTISQITTNRVNSSAAKARVDALVNYVKSKSGDPDLVVRVVPAPAKTSMNQIAVK